MLKKIKEFAEFVKTINGDDEKIDLLNEARKILHEVSPLRHHPVDFVQWVKSESVEANEYNPNAVAPPEMKLLIKSIVEDGYTMPIVTFPDQENIKIVDGFHRRKSERISSEIHSSTMGYIPISTIREKQRDLSNRMASTIRHNRARGTHSIDLMVNIVAELTEAGMGDDWIMKHIGMDADELLRLKQVSGLAALFKDREYSKAWE
ncbi:chromosome partitioning protein ParB [bacterium]|nr:chromosome partitioning protein ParB [bacterium]